ncbi:hypothetical protein MHU86_9199 [Fragilaria crotonensis]|nr:hypothetical protein MHU86_9199 [Fragilaria crotonensis]
MRETTTTTTLLDATNHSLEAQLSLISQHSGVPNQQQPRERGIEDIDNDSPDIDIYENNSAKSSTTPEEQQEQVERVPQSPDTPKRHNRTLTYEEASQWSDHDDDENDDKSKQGSKPKSLYAVGAALIFTVGAASVVADTLLNDDDDLGAFHNFTTTHNHITGGNPLQGNPTSSLQTTPDFSQTAQLASAPPPPVAAPPPPVPILSPAELQVMQQMACQAASNAAGTAGSASAAVSGAVTGGAGAATTTAVNAVIASVLALAIAASVAGGMSVRNRSAPMTTVPPVPSAAPSISLIPSLVPSTSQSPSIETCYEDPVFKNGRAVLEFEGFKRILIGNEKVLVEDAFKTAYNDVSAGCFDIYQRFLDASEIVNQTLLTDPTGPPILVAEFAATHLLDIPIFLEASFIGVHH